MKRILYLLDYLYSDAGGGTEKQFLLLYNKCEKIRVEPSVVFLQDAEVHHKLQWREPPTILNLKKLVSSKLLFSIYSLLRLIRDNKIDIVHTMYDDAAIVAYMLSFLAKDVKIIMSLRNMGHEHNRKKRKIMSQVFSRADLVTANSIAIRDLLVRDYGIEANRVEVIYNFQTQNAEANKTPDNYTDEFFDKECNKHEYTALVISNLRDVKGIEYIINSLAIIVQKADLCICIIGEGEQRAKYEKIIREKNLENYIHLLGYKQHPGYYINHSDICLLASLSEGFSNALIEYALYGKPVVATDVGGNPEILNHGEAGILVKPRDAEMMARKIVELLSSPEMQKRYSLNITDYIHTLLNEDVAIKKYRSIYSK